MSARRKKPAPRAKKPRHPRASIDATVGRLLGERQAPRFKRITAYTDAELDAAVARAAAEVPGFWTIMTGVDAYVERRRRRSARSRERLHASLRALIGEESSWGSENR